MDVRERDTIVETLVKRHPVFDAATVNRWVDREIAKYATAKIQSFVPVLVQRALDAQLAELEQTGSIPLKV